MFAIGMLMNQFVIDCYDKLSMLRSERTGCLKTGPNRPFWCVDETVLPTVLLDDGINDALAVAPPRNIVLNRLV